MKLETYIRRLNHDIGYNAPAKRAFHKESEALLKKLANALGYQPSDYTLSHNQGGIAVSGEVTLHSDTLYVQLSQSVPDFGFMWRTVQHRKDYTGGPNQWAKWEELGDMTKLAAKMKQGGAFQLPIPQPRPLTGPKKPFKVATISDNTNNFGLNGIILVAEDGEAWECAFYQPSSTIKKNDVLQVPQEGKRLAWERFEFEIPNRIKDAPENVVKEVWSR
jgi:hypothetical protein